MKKSTRGKYDTKAIKLRNISEISEDRWKKQPQVLSAAVVPRIFMRRKKVNELSATLLGDEKTGAVYEYLVYKNILRQDIAAVSLCSISGE